MGLIGKGLQNQAKHENVCEAITPERNKWVIVDIVRNMIRSWEPKDNL